MHILVFRLLLYLSLFGFTLEPRPLRSRYRPPRTFLQHIDFTDLKREQDYHLAMHPSGHKQFKIKIIEKPLNSVKKPVKQSTKKGNHSNSNNSHSSSSAAASAPSNNSTHSSSSNISPTGRNRSSPSADNSDIRGGSAADFLVSSASLDDPDIFFEATLLLYALPNEVRQEVDLLLSDLVVRLKQLLFNSLLCAYYVGFIPVQFADVRTVA
jgi:hypothetical protein